MADGTPEEVWLTIREAATRKRLSVGTIRRAYRSGALKIHRVGTKIVRIRLDWLEDWWDSGLITKTRPARVAPGRGVGSTVRKTPVEATKRD